MLTSVKRWFVDLPLASKLVTITVGVTAVVLGISSAGLFWYDNAKARTTLIREVELLADVIGTNSTAAIEFNDVHAAQEILGGVSADPRIVSAVIVRPDGTSLVRYDRGATPPAARSTTGIRTPGFAFGADSLEVTRAIEFHDERLGTVLITSDL